jgi:putative transcriptional regulator
MDKEVQQFQADLLQSIKEAKSGNGARVTKVQLSQVTEVRTKVGLPQADFAALLGVSIRTLQDWEQGRRNPSGAAKTLIRVAGMHPEALRDLLPV